MRERRSRFERSTPDVRVRTPHPAGAVRADHRGEGGDHRRLRVLLRHRQRAARHPELDDHRRAERGSRIVVPRVGRRSGDVHPERVGARRDVEPVARRGTRRDARPRDAHEGVPRAARPDREPPPGAARRAQLRVLLRRSAAVGQARRGLRARGAVAGCDHHRQALRGQRVRDRPLDEQLDHRRSIAARAVPGAVRAGGQGGRHARDHDVVQPRQRHVLHRAAVAAHRGAP